MDNIQNNWMFNKMPTIEIVPVNIWICCLKWSNTRTTLVKFAGFAKSLLKWQFVQDKAERKKFTVDSLSSFDIDTPQISPILYFLKNYIVKVPFVSNIIDLLSNLNVQEWLRIADPQKAAYISHNSFPSYSLHIIPKPCQINVYKVLRSSYTVSCVINFRAQS